MPKCMLDYAWVEEKCQMSMNLFYTFAYRLTWTYFFERTGLLAEVKDGERCISYLSIIVHHVHISMGGGKKNKWNVRRFIPPPLKHERGERSQQSSTDSILRADEHIKVWLLTAFLKIWIVRKTVLVKA